jgi:RNA polymerase sigma-70 factor (ECF subfamily)
MKRAFLGAWSSLFSVSDEQAMWRVQSQDDAQAFAQLVDRWEEPIQKLCWRMTGDTHRAEDLCQEAFARLFARRKDYRAAARFSTFLWRIALNLCYDELRRRHRRGESSLDETDATGSAAIENLATPEPPPDAMLEFQERAALVRAALLSLTEGYRAVVVLRHYENLKFREIAEVLEIPEGTVKSRMAEALSQLNQLLSRSWQEGTLCQRNHKPSHRLEIRAL